MSIEYFSTKVFSTNNRKNKYTKECFSVLSKSGYLTGLTIEIPSTVLLRMLETSTTNELGKLYLPSFQTIGNKSLLYQPILSYIRASIELTALYFLYHQ